MCRHLCLHFGDHHDSISNNNYDDSNDDDDDDDGDVSTNAHQNLREPEWVGGRILWLPNVTGAIKLQAKVALRPKTKSQN